MYSSPSKSWLIGVAFSGLLLAGSLLAPAYSHSIVMQPMSKKVSSASDYKQVSIARFPKQRTPWNSVGLTEATNTFKAQYSQIVAKPSDSNSQNVHIAQESPSSPSQISRGTNTSSTIVEHALSLLGTPYVFGGTTRRGLDCSGFTRYVFVGSGISLPRTSYAQFASGVAVSRDNLQPGDLVFFTTYAKGASHVGIYIGGGRFVEASNPTSGVKISSLSESFYTSRYLGARRYL